MSRTAVIFLVVGAAGAGFALSRATIAANGRYVPLPDKSGRVLDSASGIVYDAQWARLSEDDWRMAALDPVRGEVLYERTKPAEPPPPLRDHPEEWLRENGPARGLTARYEKLAEPARPTPDEFATQAIDAGREKFGFEFTSKHEREVREWAATWAKYRGPSPTK